MTEAEIRADEQRKVVARIVAWLRNDPERLARVLWLAYADPPSVVIDCVADAIENGRYEEVGDD